MARALPSLLSDSEGTRRETGTGLDGSGKGGLGLSGSSSSSVGGNGGWLMMMS